MRKGQGLLETTIAIAVLVTGVVAAMSLAYSNTISVDKGSLRIVAANLAREALEVLHYKRDTNWMQGLNFDDGMFSGTDYTFAEIFNSSTGSWTFNFTPNDANHAQAQVSRRGGLYLQTSDGEPPLGGETTHFKRIVEANLICRRPSDGSMVIVTSGAVCTGSYTRIGRQIVAKVSWDEKGTAQNFAIEDRIYDWR